jgi:hypothetical protein
LDVLKKQYEITKDHNNTQKYVGLTIAHGLVNNTISLFMPGYVEKALARFDIIDAKDADSTSMYILPEYGKAV